VVLLRRDFHAFRLNRAERLRKIYPLNPPEYVVKCFSYEFR